ncbi:MAG: hypothetical protein J6U38_03265 [Clostridia bacterium]|nr:hypothetical protein [Clostridia bacterium]MBO7503365.1 hypothetical protein [Clostridia bacterium]
MELSEYMLKDGLKFIVGKWQADYVVNAFSNDLAHIPAAEFKSEDGRTFEDLKFEFFEDHTVKVQVEAGKDFGGTWEQTGMMDYRYKLEAFEEIPEGFFKDAAEKLDVLDGHLVFAIGFLAVALKKTEDGQITKEPDIGDLAPSEEDLNMNDIAGEYEVAKAKTFACGKFDLFTKEEVVADFNKRVENGEAEPEELADAVRAFEMIVEFTADHRVVEWMPLPAGVPEEAIKAALEAGEISAVKDGRFTGGGGKEWKAVNGKYYYNTGEHREMFDEVQSPWDELVFDEEGLMDFSSGLVKLRKK